MQVCNGHRKAHLLASLAPPPRTCCTSHRLPQPCPSARTRKQRCLCVWHRVLCEKRPAEVTLKCEWQTPRSYCWGALELSSLKLKTLQVTLEMVAAGHDFHLCLSSSFLKTLPEGFFFFFSFLFFFNKWVLFHELCVYMFLQEHLYISMSCFLSLQGKVVTFWCRLWTLMKHHLSWERNVCSNSGETFSFSDYIIGTSYQK